MQVSLDWLNDFVDLSGITPEEIAHKLTMSGLEVEEVEYRKVAFENIKTVQIIKIDNHPNADKLHLVTVTNGVEEKVVVCGAQNIKEGQIIPYASVGSVVYSRKTGEKFTLTPAVIRGVESQGMLCSQDELGLEGMQEEDGILILSDLMKKVELNKPLEEVLNLKEEVIFHTAPTANRGDEMSVLGIARELSSLFGRKLNFSPLEFQGKLTENDFKVEIIDEETCKYYSIGVVKDIKIKPSPDFMQRRLLACGMRPINNIVDITNYVQLELGEPLHAFDLDKVGNYLCVRYAQEGEKLTTLDEVERQLTKNSVLIADKEKGVCLAGVFGGNNSEIDDNSKNIALEAAYFTPHTNRKSARSVGYISEASQRFQRGVDRGIVKPALMRAIELVVKYADGKLTTIVETGEATLPEIEITLRNSEISRILGIDIPQETYIPILENLGFELVGKNELAAKFKVPTHRQDDVYREIDLIEEISRIHGFDNIAPTIPPLEEGVVISNDEKNLKKINEIFLGNGFDEIMTSSLVGDNFCKLYGTPLNDEYRVRVKNPKSEDSTTLRQSLMPSLFNVIKYNFDNGCKNFRFYEIGRIYKKLNETTMESSGVVEQRRISGVITGCVNNEIWNDTHKNDFYLIKGALDLLFDELKLTNRIVYSKAQEETPNYLHPAQSAKIELMGKNREVLGFVGKVHPNFAKNLKLNQDLFVFEINLEAILGAINNSITKFKKLPQTLPIQRDIAFGVNSEVEYGTIEKVIKKYANKAIFKSCQIFDIYEGEKIEAGKKSLAVRITLQDDKETLKDEQIDTEITKIRAELEKSIDSLSLR